MCRMAAGSCDVEGKGCCVDDQSSVHYCAATGLTCDQDAERPRCTACGASRGLCCLRYNQDFKNIKTLPNTRFLGACASSDEACSFDATSETAGKCLACGKAEASPCCWVDGVPTCDVEAGLMCQGVKGRESGVQAWEASCSALHRRVPTPGPPTLPTLPQRGLTWACPRRTTSA